MGYEKKTETAKSSRGLGTMDIILIILGVYLLIFSIAMICIYIATGGYPETLCTCTYGLCGGECGILGWIKTAKERRWRRQYQKEDTQDDTPEDGAVG